MSDWNYKSEKTYKIDRLFEKIDFNINCLLFLALIELFKCILSPFISRVLNHFFCVRFERGGVSLPDDASRRLSGDRLHLGRSREKGRGEKRHENSGFLHNAL